MVKYIAVLGRQPLISVAELESLFKNVRLVAPGLAEFELKSDSPRDRGGLPNIDRLGGTLKIAEQVSVPIDQFCKNLPANGKITLGVSDFSRGANAGTSQKEALRLKRSLVKLGHSVRVIPNQAAVLSSATTLHNKLFKDLKIELLKNGRDFYRVVAVQKIDSYVKRDQARPARDAKVGMLPPKLAQILINLCGTLPSGTRLLDPFCGTGVVLQEAFLMGYVPYGTDLNERMIDYSEKNLAWLEKKKNIFLKPASLTEKDDTAGLAVSSLKTTSKPLLQQGDAQNFTWTSPVGAVACETYLGPPMSQPPVEIKLRQAKQECKSIILGFLKNLSEQITTNTPVVVAVPAWLRPDGHYERLNLLDEIEKLRYNVVRFKNLGQKDLLYHRDGQVVAREIIVLRKK